MTTGQPRRCYFQPHGPLDTFGDAWLKGLGDDVPRGDTFCPSFLCFVASVIDATAKANYHHQDGEELICYLFWFGFFVRVYNLSCRCQDLLTFPTVPIMHCTLAAYVSAKDKVKAFPALVSFWCSPPIYIYIYICVYIYIYLYIQI